MTRWSCACKKYVACWLNHHQRAKHCNFERSLQSAAPPVFCQQLSLELVVFLCPQLRLRSPQIQFVALPPQRSNKNYRSNSKSMKFCTNKLRTSVESVTMGQFRHWWITRLCWVPLLARQRQMRQQMHCKRFVKIITENESEKHFFTTQKFLIFFRFFACLTLSFQFNKIFS